MQLRWGVTSAVKKSVLEVWTEGRVVERALGPEQWAAQTLFLKWLHAGNSDDDSKGTICFGSFFTFSSAVKLETLFPGTKSSSQPLVGGANSCVLFWCSIGWVWFQLCERTCTNGVEWSLPPYSGNTPSSCSHRRPEAESLPSFLRSGGGRCPPHRQTGTEIFKSQTVQGLPVFCHTTMQLQQHSVCLHGFGYPG